MVDSQKADDADQPTVQDDFGCGWSVTNFLAGLVVASACDTAPADTSRDLGFGRSTTTDSEDPASIFRIA